jgi:hypothetical protein
MWATAGGASAMSALDDEPKPIGRTNKKKVSKQAAKTAILTAFGLALAKSSMIAFWWLVLTLGKWQSDSLWTVDVDKLGA